MHLRYIGGFDAVEVDMPSGASVEVERDGTGEFPDEMAERMLEQSIWAPADPPAPVVAEGDPPATVVADDPPADDAAPAAEGT